MATAPQVPVNAELRRESVKENVGIHLDSPASCQAELEECSNRMALLTGEATRNLEALGVIDEQLELVEAIVRKSVREGLDTKPTAQEVRARTAELISEDDVLAPVRLAAHSLRSEKESLERRLKTLEKRSQAAMAALKAHLGERYTGHSGGAGI